MSIFRLFPVLQRPEVAWSVPRLCSGCSGFNKLNSTEFSSRYYGSKPNPQTLNPHKKEDKLQISYHNGKSALHGHAMALFACTIQVQVLDSKSMSFSVPDYIRILTRIFDRPPRFHTCLNLVGWAIIF